jgi:Ca2+-binding EF-hand superfamily protein
MSSNQDRQFQKLDRDGDGKLSRDEVRDRLKGQGLPCDETSLNALFSSVDVDSDGFISQKEFFDFSGKRNSEMEAMFNLLDKDHSGTISKGEIRKGLAGLGIVMSSADVAVLLNRIDDNHDGSITLQEFKRFMYLAPDIVNMGTLIIQVI